MSYARLLTVILLAFSASTGYRPARAAEVDLEEGQRTIDSIQIFKADGAANEYYYLPTDIRFSLDQQGEPSFLLLKYNLPSDVGYAVSDLDGTKKMAKQGGILAFEVTYTLDETKRAAIEAKLRAETSNPNATLALMPLDQATISLEYIDPDSKDVKVKLPEETAPLSGNIVSWVIPLSKDATDIMYDAFSKPSSTAILRAKLAFDFSGYTAPLRVTLSGNWENVYNHHSWNANMKGGVWFFKAKGDVQNVSDQMQQDGTLKVEWKGGANPDVQKLVDRLTDLLLPAIFDTSHFKIEDPAKAAPAESGLFGWGGGVSFARKDVNRTRRGHFQFDLDRKEKVTRRDGRYSRFTDMDKLSSDDKKRERHFRQVTPGDWGMVAPRFFVNADLSQYAKVVVNVRYGGAQKEATFSSETGRANQVPGEWNLDPKRPEDKKYEYEYQIDATLRDGVVPANVISTLKYPTPWAKSDKVFLTLSPEDWKGPVKTRLTIKPVIGMEDVGAKLVLVTVKWNSGKPVSKTFAFKGADDKDQVWESFAVFDIQPEYNATVEYLTKDGKKGPFNIKHGDTGASDDELLVILSILK